MRTWIRAALLAALLTIPGLASAEPSDFDMCPNLDGLQRRVPGNYEIVFVIEGGIIVGWECVPK